MFNGDIDFELDFSEDEEDISANDDKIKKSLFGGYSKMSVDSYITNLEKNMVQMKNNLELQIKELVREKEGMFQENQLLKAQFNEVEEKEKKLQVEYNELKEDSSELIDLLEKIKDEKDYIAKKLVELEEELDKKDAEIKTKMQELIEKDRQIEDMKGQLEDSNINLKGAYEEISIKDQKISEKQEEIESLRETITNIKDTSGEIDESKVNELEEKINELEEKIMTLEEEKNALEQEKKENLIEIKSLKERILSNNSRVELEKIKEENSLLILEKNNQINQLELEKNRLKNQLEIEIQEKNNLKDNFSKEMEEIRNRSINTKGKELDELNNRIRQLEDEKGELVYRTTYLKTENENLKRESSVYNDVRAKFDILYNQFLEAQEEIEKVNIDKQILEEDIKRYKMKEREFIFLKKNTESHREKIHSLESDLNEMIQQMEIQSKTIQDLMIKYQEEQSKNRAILREKTNLQSSNVDLLEELRKVNKKLAELNFSIDTIQEDANNKSEMLTTDEPTNNVNYLQRV